MTDEERQKLLHKLRMAQESEIGDWFLCAEAADEIERLAALAQSDAEPVAWKPDANMRAELDRSELVARALLKEVLKQIDCIEAEGNIEWHKRIKLSGELYLPDLAASVLAVLYTAPPRPDASAGPAAWRSTPAMRARIRELSRPDSDDYDRAVIAVLDDFDNMLGEQLWK